MIKTIILDIGNVLFFFSYSKMFRQVGKICGLNEEEIYHEIFEKNIGVLYERGDLTTSEVFEHFARKATRPLIGYEDFREAITDIFIPNSSLYPLIKALKKQNLRLLLISNTCEAHFDYIQKKYPILQLFEDSALSYKLKARKPERAIFEEVLRLADCAPEECFYTDDIHEYVLEARDMGIDAEVFKDSATLRRMLILRGLKNL